MPDPPTPPRGPEPCAPPDDALALQGLHECYPDKNGADRSFYIRHPGQVPPGAGPHHGDRPANVTRGFNFGLLLFPYINDWRVQLAPMTRRRAYPVIFHSFPSHYDRTYALATITHFVPPNDKYAPPFMLHIIQLKPFAGYRWQVQAARRWLTYADAVGNALGGPRSTDAAGALARGSAWIEAVRPLWERLTPERFPYEPTNFVLYYQRDEPAAALSATG